MPDASTTPQRLRLSSREYSGRDKVAALRELFGRELMRLELWSCKGAAPLDFTATLMPLGGGAVYARCEHTPAHMWRSPELVRDGADDIFLTTSRAGCAIRTASGYMEMPAGSFALHSKARAHEFIHPKGGQTASIQVSRAVLAKWAPDLEEAPVRLLPPGTPGAGLAMGYASLLADSAPLPQPQLGSAALHLHELLAGIIKPARPAMMLPKREAVDVPRMALIRRDILARIDRPDLSLVQIARLHHLTPRQVQRLFAREDTCFSDVVRQARLERARAMLTDPRQRRRRVLEIALDSGFDDVSAFGRAFRRHFGMTPSEARSQVPVD